MMADLKPYPAYKDSGVEWLGEVPEHWEVRRLKTLCSMRSGEGITAMSIEATGEYPVYGGNGLRGYAPDYTHDGSFALIGRQGALCGNVHIARGKFWASEHAVVATLYPGHVLEWFGAILRAMNLNQYSIAAAQPGLAVERVLNLALPVPPSQEQTAITHFLDYTDRRIQRYLQAKQKLITLLEEQRQAIIHQAVTGQIDVRTGQPYPAYKDSGVEWLGEVPEHWRLARLKDVAQVQTGLTLGNRDYGGVQTESRPYLSVANVQVGRLDLTHVKHIDIPPNEAARVTLRDGDVLMTEGGDIDKLGRGCVWHDEIPGCLHQNHIFAVRCRPRVFHPELLVGLMASQHGRTYFQLTAKQTTNLASTNSSTLRAFPVFLPPIREQLAIVDALSKQTVALNNTMDQVRREISLLNEYRTRLISDVVTGKLDVREAAARLPEVDPLETEADSEESLDTGAESNLNELGTKVKEVVT